MRRGLATVCLSGSLDDKLAAAAAAGFSGVEIFENDLVTSPLSPAAVRERAGDLGLTVDLYQPFRDFEAVPADVLARNLRRAEAKFDVMAELGADTVLVCSSVSPDSTDDDDLAAEQLHALAERAGRRGLRVAYEALAWGRHVSDYQHSWEIVRRADHPSLGLCLDSFHILSRGSDPAGIADIPGDKLFFLQLADAPALAMDVLQWSRHFRCFPGQGSFDLPAFLEHVVRAGYRGPLSLEVFNDVFRQSDPRRTAVDAMRSLLGLEEQLGLRLAGDPDRRPAVELHCPPPPVEPSGYAFVELAVDGASGPLAAGVLSGLGFVHAGQHRSKPVALWQHGGARVLLNYGDTRVDGRSPGEPFLTALAVETADPTTSARRAEQLLAPVLPRAKGPAEADLSAVAAPDGTSVFFARAGADADTSWLSDFTPTGVDGGPGLLTAIDHVALSQPFDAFDEAALFYPAVLGLRPQESLELSAPYGLVRSRAVRNLSGSVRFALNVPVLRGGSAAGWAEPQHVAFACDDVFAVARVLRDRGAPLLPVPENYYRDLDARFSLPEGLLDDLRSAGVLYDADASGAFFHLYTQLLGSRLFFEVVQRTGAYDGYGAVNAPVRMAAQVPRA